MIGDLGETVFKMKFKESKIQESCEHIYGYCESGEERWIISRRQDVNDYKNHIAIPFTYCPKCGKRLVD